jgi:hypothetical protein
MLRILGLPKLENGNFGEFKVYSLLMVKCLVRWGYGTGT